MIENYRCKKGLKQVATDSSLGVMGLGLVAMGLGLMAIGFGFEAIELDLAENEEEQCLLGVGTLYFGLAPRASGESPSACGNSLSLLVLGILEKVNTPSLLVLGRMEKEISLSLFVLDGMEKGNALEE